MVYRFLVWATEIVRLVTSLGGKDRRRRFGGGSSI